jgi:hypothetical protein
VRSKDSVDKVSGELMEKVSRLMDLIGRLTADRKNSAGDETNAPFARD